jgi:curved DNA-binding protein CbpA
MTNNPILDALDTLKLPTLITKDDIKRQYRHLAKISHPDRGGNASDMEKLNSAYALLIKYVDGFKYSFSDEEIYRQFPEDFHTSKFRP